MKQRQQQNHSNIGCFPLLELKAVNEIKTTINDPQQHDDDNKWPSFKEAKFAHCACAHNRHYHNDTTHYTTRRKPPTTTTTQRRQRMAELQKAKFALCACAHNLRPTQRRPIIPHIVIILSDDKDNDYHHKYNNANAVHNDSQHIEVQDLWPLG
jgi:hypothetical protein